MYSHTEIKKKQSTCDWRTHSQMKSGDGVQGHHGMPWIEI